MHVSISSENRTYAFAMLVQLAFEMLVQLAFESNPNFWEFKIEHVLQFFQIEI